MSKRDRQRSARRRGRVEKKKQERRAEARANLVYDPATAPARAATLLREQFGDTPVEPAVALRIVSEGGVPRAREVADAALSLGRGPMALSLAADVALLDDRPADAERYAADAVELLDSPDLQVRLATARANQGRLADALDVIDAQLRADAGHLELQFMRGDLLELVQAHVDDPPADCPCGSGAPYQRCCGPAELRALERFGDRRALLELRVAVARFVTSVPECDEAFDRGVLEWEEVGAITEAEGNVEVGTLQEDPWHRAANLMVLAGEWSWMVPLLELEKEDDSSPLPTPGPASGPLPREGGGKGGFQSILERYAADPDAPEEARRRATVYDGWAMWGLWEVGRPAASPGVPVTDVLTGIRLYADIPSEIVDGLPRWSVLLGYLVPVDGVWRAGGGFAIASPVEAREIAHELVDELLDDSHDEGTQSQPLVAWCRRVHDDMGSLWMADVSDVPSPVALSKLQTELRAVAPDLCASLRKMQESEPDADGETDPDRLWADIYLDDPRAAVRALAAQPGYEVVDSRTATWREVPSGRLRGTLTIDLDLDSLYVRFEASARLADLHDLLDLLDQLGYPADDVEGPVAERRPNPPMILPDLPEAEVEAWLRRWPDEPVELFDGLTPRQAVERQDAMAEVEMLIRYLEHDADLRELYDLDTYRLREDLGLLEEDDPAEDASTGARPSA